MVSAIWELNGVRLDGRNAVRLQALDLRIRTGVTAVLGPSGAGKTSLLDLLVEFEKPDAGEVVRHRPEGFSLPVYWVPQDYGLWPELTAVQHLQAVSEAPRRDCVELLTEFGLGHRTEAHPDEMSMGERARLAVARALASDAGVLVMDEPLAHVDEATVSGYWEAMLRRVRSRGGSLVFATHDPRRVVGTAEDVVCLREGRVLYTGDVNSLYLEPETREQAECLGEVNWLEPEEGALWLGNGHAARCCYRPEQIALRESPEGQFLVRESRFRGPIAETRLEQSETGRTRVFRHRPSGDHLNPGRRVVIKVLAALLLLIVLGCRRGEQAALVPRDVRYWGMPAEGASIPAPRSIGFAPSGVAYVLDTAGRVLVFDTDGHLIRKWFMPEYDIGKPEGICVLRDGRVAVCDTHYHRVVFFSPEGDLLGSFGQKGEADGQFIFPVAVDQDDKGFLYVVEYGGNDRVQKFTADGDHVLTFGTVGSGPGEFQRPSSISWVDGRLYIADAMNNRVLEFADNGTFIGILGRPDRAPSLHFPYGAVRGPGGDFYVVEYGAGRVTRLDGDGRVLGRYGGPGHGAGKLRTPWGIAVHGRRLCIADTGNRRIVELIL